MDLVDEEDGVLLEIGKHASEISRPLDHRSRRCPNCYAHLVADDVRQRGLAEPGRTVEQHMIERFTATACSGNRDLQVIAQTILPNVLVERTRTQSRLVLRVLVHTTGRNQSFVHV